MKLILSWKMPLIPFQTELKTFFMPFIIVRAMLTRPFMAVLITDVMPFQTDEVTPLIAFQAPDQSPRIKAVPAFNKPVIMDKEVLIIVRIIFQTVLTIIVRAFQPVENAILMI